MPKYCYLQVFNTMRSGTRPLTSATASLLDAHQSSSKISFCCLSHRDPVALVLQDGSLHILHQVINGLDVGVKQFRALGVDLGDSLVGQQVASPWNSPRWRAGAVPPCPCYHCTASPQPARGVASFPHFGGQQGAGPSQQGLSGIQTTGICTAFSGNTGHRCQPRPRSGRTT